MQSVKFSFLMIFLVLVGAFVVPLSAISLSDEQKAKVNEQLKILQAWGTDPTVVAAVKEASANPPAAYKDMNQDKWKTLSVLSPEVRFFSSSALAVYLKERRKPVMTELFISAANGTKVAFFSKTSSWSHAGKAKHEDPMKGKTWIGEPEQDESTGKIQVQIAFPIYDGKKVIGSMVIGLDVSKL